MPDEAEFAQTFQDAHENLHRVPAEKAKQTTEQWRDRPIEANRKIIYRHPDMQWIIEAGSRKPY